MKVKKVFVCSPFRRTHKISFWEQRKNINNVKRYCKTIVNNGMIPIAPHLYFPQFLDDNKLRDRTIGMTMGLKLLKECDYMYVYGDRITNGMEIEIARAKKLGIPIIEKKV